MTVLKCRCAGNTKNTQYVVSLFLIYSLLRGESATASRDLLSHSKRAQLAIADATRATVAAAAAADDDDDTEDAD